MLNFVEDFGEPTRIKVVGVGGGGSNAVSEMFKAGVSGVEFICINTDTQALKEAAVPNKVQIGTKLTRGRGAGGDLELGRRAAEEDRDKIAQAIDDAEMVFITAGLGGGTGTGASPIIGEISRAGNALTIGIVTKPFLFEGSQRLIQAEQGMKELQDKVDTLIVIPNQRVQSLVTKETSFVEAFRKTDEVLYQATCGIAELITEPGLINLDFADVKTIMADAGCALISMGCAEGENRTIKAVEAALANPLLEDVQIEGARGILINVVGGSDLTFVEVNEAVYAIAEKADKQANIIFGTSCKEGLANQVKVTVVATGFPTSKEGQKSKVAHKGVELDAELNREKILSQSKEPVKIPVRQGWEERIETHEDEDLDVPAFKRRKEEEQAGS